MGEDGDTKLPAANAFAPLISDEPSRQIWIHPLARPEIKSFLSIQLPDNFKERLDHLTFPKGPYNEADEKLVKRKERIGDYENLPTNPVDKWVARLIYEECFAVSPAMTLGGILTHSYRNEIAFATGTFENGKRLHFNIGQVLEFIQGKSKEIFKLSANELLVQIKQGLLETNAEQNTKTGEFFNVYKMAQTYGAFINSQFSMGWYQTPEELLEDWGNATSPQNIQQFENGWTFLQTYNLYREKLETPCEDQQLLAFLKKNLEPGEIPDRVSRIQALQKLWLFLGQDGGPVLYEDGTFKSKEQEEYQGGLEGLILVRSSPDFSFLFNFFSAKSAIEKS